MSLKRNDIEKLIHSQAALIRKEKPDGFVMRHSIRDDIEDLRNPFAAMLTEEGITAAFEFGKLMPTDRPLKLISSTVQRCRDTASAIAEGVKAAGGEITCVEADELLQKLGGDDEAALLEEVQSRGPHQFFNDWVNGHIPPETALFEFNEAADHFRLNLLKRLSQGMLTLFVTHDFHLNYIRPDRDQLRHPGFRWPGFLEGYPINFPQRKSV